MQGAEEYTDVTAPTNNKSERREERESHAAELVAEGSTSIKFVRADTRARRCRPRASIVHGARRILIFPRRTANAAHTAHRYAQVFGRLSTCAEALDLIVEPQAMPLMHSDSLQRVARVYLKVAFMLFLSTAGLVSSAVWADEITYEYDALGRLSKSIGDTTQTQYTLDAAGNRTNVQTSPSKVIQLAVSALTRAENGGGYTLNVQRLGSNQAGQVGVSYSVTGTPVGTPNYSVSSGTLTWAANDAADKTIPITITNDSVWQGSGNETVTITLNTPTGGAVIGSPSTFVLTITEDDANDYQITDSLGNVLSAASALYGSSQTCAPLPFGMWSCTWSLKKKYGSLAVVWSTTYNSTSMAACPFGFTATSTAGYSRPSTSSCGIMATSAVYGQ
jgi:hypothetical protein